MNYQFVPKVISLLTLILLFPLCPASPISPDAANAGASSSTEQLDGKLSTEGSTTFDGQSLAAIPAAPDAATVIASAASISQAGWTVTADSAESGYPASNAIDGSNTTFWHTEYTPDNVALPHMITVDMGQSYTIGSITYLPRQDGQSDGNIGQHQIQLSGDGTTFTTVAQGTWIDDATLKTTTFTPSSGQYVRIVATTEAGNRGPWSSCAEINIYTADPNDPPAAGSGAWTSTIEFPLVPVSAAIEWSSGNLLVWSSYSPSTFGGSNLIQTVTATYDLATGTVTEALITNTDHDMFCEGLSMIATGQIFATGGNTDAATSYYDSPSNSWAAAATMNIARGYQAQVTISTGQIFVIGASWSGGLGGKNAEIYQPGANTWTLLPGCPVAPMLTADAQGVYRADNHGWLFAWSDGYVFQAGPSAAMNWYGTADGGSQTGAGTRAADPDSMCGDAIMYDAVAGKILTVGGSPDYQDSYATSNAHIITLGAPGEVPTVTAIGNMAYARAFANGVILADGTVLITGGQTYAVPFSDDNSILIPELFDPGTETFTQLAPMSIPRNYHTVGILLPDATVGNGGGGLCGDCATNHFDMEIFTPPYLYAGSGALAARPVISSVSTGSVAVGASFTATTAGGVDSFSIIRLTSTTHTVNTDQRFIALTPSATAGTTYTLTIPSDPGVAVPGVWYLFALAGGVPSVASYLTVTL